MNAEEYISIRKSSLGLQDWFLELVPEDGRGGGSNLTTLPSDLLEQARRFKLSGTTSEILIGLLRNDLVREAVDELLPRLPGNLATLLRPCETLAYGMVNDATFNGEVRRVPQSEAVAVVIPFGSFVAISYFALVQVFCGSNALQAYVSEGGSEDLGIGEGSLLRLSRRLKLRVSQKFLHPRFRQSIPNELLLMAECYNDIGVIDPPTIMREISRLPLPPNPRRVGHPLEAGSILGYFGQRFLLLHECGHVVSNHIYQTDKDTSQKEFEADRWAFECCLRISPTEKGKVTSLLGAWLVLNIAAAIERRDVAAMETHPLADKRIDALRQFIFETPHLDDLARRNAHNFLNEMSKRDQEYQRSANYLLQILESTRLSSDTLGRFIERCIHEQQPQSFKDQFPRWVLLGAPSALCESLARARVRYEREENKPALDLVEWAFDCAQRAPSQTVFQALSEAYNRYRGSAS